MTQIQWYLGITGLNVAHLAVLVGGQELRQFRVPANPEAYEALGAAADRFWHTNIVGGRAPALVPEDSGFMNARLPADPDAEPVVPEPEVLELLHMARHARVEEAWWGGTKDAAEAAVKAAMGPATELVAPDGRTVATWRPSTRTSVSVKRLRAEHPDIPDDFYTRTLTRRFTIKEDQ
jgi:predicted phage-related endonuclease